MVQALYLQPRVQDFPPAAWEPLEASLQQGALRAGTVATWIQLPWQSYTKE